YPDWQASAHHVRLIDKEGHNGLLITLHECRFLQDTGDPHVTKRRADAIPTTLLQALEAATLTRAGRRCYFVYELGMEFQSLVDLFRRRYPVEDDPAEALGHQVNDTVYRVITTDDEGWRWNIGFA